MQIYDIHTGSQKCALILNLQARVHNTKQLGVRVSANRETIYVRRRGSSAWPRTPYMH